MNDKSPLFLKQLSVKNFRAFVEEQSVMFGIPDGEKCGSGLTVITGVNNCGKTSLLESLLIRPDSVLDELDRHRNPMMMQIILDNENITKLSNVDNGPFIKLLDSSTWHGIKFEVVASRRQWNTEANTKHGKEIYFNGAWQQLRNISSFPDFGGVLNTIYDDKQRKKDFTRLVQKLVPNFTDWQIGYMNKTWYVKYITGCNAAEHNSDKLGDGVISLLRICAHLFEDSQNGLIIDEPELSLHPEAQEELSKLISEKSKSRQIVFCTHSPYFINWDDFINGAKFIRVNKYDDKGSKICMLSNKTKYAEMIEGIMSDFEKPQLLDTAAKEIMFLENVLFVEGQEDLGIIKKYAKDNNVPLNFKLFGYGSGGHGNIPMFLQMARDLGIRKVAAIFDGDRYAKISFEKALEENKDDGYKLQQLPTPDIRDKPCKEHQKNFDIQCAECSKRKGIFDKSGELKNGTSEEKNNSSTFEQMIVDLLAYFGD